MQIKNKIDALLTAVFLGEKLMVSQTAIFEIGYRFMRMAYIDIIRPELEPLVQNTATTFDDTALKILDRIFDCFDKET